MGSGGYMEKPNKNAEVVDFSAAVTSMLRYLADQSISFSMPSIDAFQHLFDALFMRQDT